MIKIYVIRTLLSRENGCIILTRKLTRLRRRIGLQVKLFLLNLYVVGILKSNWIGLQVKLGID